MAEADLDTADLGANELVLDPFAHLPGVASRIVGLGGSTPGHDPSYVFHTDYIEAAPGVAHFKVSFNNLTAKQGTLVFRVHMLANEPGAHSILATSERVQLNRLIAQGGVANVRFEAFRGVRFALYGSLPGNTDAAADGLSITLDRPAHLADAAALDVDGRTSAYGRDKAKQTQHLISLEPATLRNPVTQICTDRQLREPIYREWAAELDFAEQSPAERWSAVYVMQVLSRYGLLVPGASGLGIGIDSIAIPAAIAARGASVVAVRHRADDGTADAGIEDIDHAGNDPAPGPSAIAYKTADIGDLPRDILNFDFAWSCGWAARRGSIAAGISWINESLTRLRPGGLAVHTMPYIPSSSDNAVEHGGTVSFRRRDLERLALTLISRGHEVAQIKIDGAAAPSLDDAPADAASSFATACGIVIRKAATAL